MSDDRNETYAAFKQAVNMPPARLEKWRSTEESKEVGYKDGGEGESVGHKLGERIVAIKRTKKADLSEDDYAHMRKVVAYVARHTKQGGPAKDKEHSRWRYSLMNWGHDPLK